MEQPSEQIEAFQRVIDALEGTGIPYAVTGSWVVSAYGILRATHDLDVVIAVRGEDAAKIVAAFPYPRYYADGVAITEAIAARSFFNVIDGDSTLKIDFWPLKDDDYSQEQFRRRNMVRMGERHVWALTSEDIILAKLLWIKMSDSERQWRDVQSVWALKKAELDLAYLRLWASRLSIADLLSKVTSS
jgi:hypothetical protein